MMQKQKIEKALIHNGVKKDNIVVVKTDITITFSIQLLRLLVLLLCNFFLLEKVSEEHQIDFINNNITKILDIVQTELRIALHNFVYIYNEELAKEIELHNKDETWLFLTIQEKVNKELKERGF